MSDREHFIATLQACYFGDRNAFDEIVRIYDKKERIEVVKDRTKGYLDIPTLQAINKQVEELQWKVD